METRLRPPTNIFLALLLSAGLLGAEEALPPELEGIDVEEKLGQKIDLDLTFTAENGYPATLRSFFKEGKPVILNLVYYRCPMLCNLVLNGQTDALREIPWTPGNEFEIVTVSIDPAETFALAAKKKQFYLATYDRPATGWHFLTDKNGNVQKLADQVGFRYRYDERQQQFVHAAAIMVLTPDGRVSRYLYGAKFKPRDVRLALTEASEGKLGTTVDKLLMFCFHYDSAARSYVPFARNIMRAGGVLVILIFGSVLVHLWRRERMTHSPQPVVTAK
ncbi:MAG: SCO family protein [Bryobacteraceae bacterium]